MSSCDRCLTIKRSFYSFYSVRNGRILARAERNHRAVMLQLIASCYIFYEIYRLYQLPDAPVRRPSSPSVPQLAAVGDIMKTQATPKSNSFIYGLSYKMCLARDSTSHTKYHTKALKLTTWGCCRTFACFAVACCREKSESVHSCDSM